MLQTTTLLALFLLSFIPGNGGYSWSSSLADMAVKYACAGQTVTLPWGITLSPNEQIINIQWMRHVSGKPDEILAMNTRGNFVDMPAFASRVTSLGSAGIQLDHVTVADTGNYSVLMTAQTTDGSTFSLSHVAMLEITGDKVTTDGSLHVTQEPTVGQGGELTCGHFSYLHTPPFDVQWSDPSGAVHASSHYSEGKFHLLLSNPLQYGEYKCLLPSGSPAFTCPSTNGQHSLEASVSVVDDVRAHLAALEALEKQLETKTDAMKQEIDIIKAQNVQLPGGNSLQQNASLLDLLKELENRTAQATQQLTQKNSELAMLLAGVEVSVNQSTSSLTQQFLQLAQQNAQLQRDNGDLASRVANLETQLARNTQDTSGMQQQLNQLTIMMSEKTANFSTQSERLAIQLHDVESHVTQVANNCTQQSAQLVGTLTAMAKTEQGGGSHATVTALTHRVDTLEGAVDTNTQRLQTGYSVQTAAIAALQIKANHLDDKLNQTSRMLSLQNKLLTANVKQDVMQQLNEYKISANEHFNQFVANETATLNSNQATVQQLTDLMTLTNRSLNNLLGGQMTNLNATQQLNMLQELTSLQAMTRNMTQQIGLLQSTQTAEGFVLQHKIEEFEKHMHEVQIFGNQLKAENTNIEKQLDILGKQTATGRPNLPSPMIG